MPSKLKHLSDAIRLSRKVTLRTAALGGFVVYFVLRVIEEIIGNYGYETFKSVIHPTLKRSLYTNYYSIIGIAIAVSLISLLIAHLYFRNVTQGFVPSLTTLNRFQNTLHSLRSKLFWEIGREISDNMQGTLQAGDEAALDAFVNHYFMVIFKHLGVNTFCAGGVLLPDEDSPDTLSFWRMSPDQALSPKKFYIGQTRLDGNLIHPRGTAGTVFREGAARIVRILNRETGEADDPTFHRFNIDRPLTPYASFISLPIKWDNQVVGVLSIECQDVDGFSSDDGTYLEETAKILGTVLFYFNKIQHSTSAQKRSSVP